MVQIVINDRYLLRIQVVDRDVINSMQQVPLLLLFLSSGLYEHETDKKRQAETCEIFALLAAGPSSSTLMMVYAPSWWCILAKVIPTPELLPSSPSDRSNRSFVKDLPATSPYSGVLGWSCCCCCSWGSCLSQKHSNSHIGVDELASESMKPIAVESPDQGNAGSTCCFRLLCAIVAKAHVPMGLSRVARLPVVE